MYTSFATTIAVILPTLGCLPLVGADVSGAAIRVDDTLRLASGDRVRVGDETLLASGTSVGARLA